MNPRLQIDPAVCHGKPVIRGTRVLVSTILGALGGGDSIEAIQVQHAIHRDFDLRVKNTEFLAEPTIAALAALIAARAEGDAATRPA